MYFIVLHVIAYRSVELLLGTHAFNCFLDYSNCVFTQIRTLAVLLLPNLLSDLLTQEGRARVDIFLPPTPLQPKGPGEGLKAINVVISDGSPLTV